MKKNIIFCNLFLEFTVEISANLAVITRKDKKSVKNSQESKYLIAGYSLKISYDNLI